MRNKLLNTTTLILYLTFIGIMSSNGPASAAVSSSAIASTESEKEDFEKHVKAELKDVEGKINDLHSNIKKTHMLGKHHRNLKRAARHMESDVKDVEHLLSQFKKAPEKVG